MRDDKALPSPPFPTPARQTDTNAATAAQGLTGAAAGRAALLGMGLGALGLGGSTLELEEALADMVAAGAHGALGGAGAGEGDEEARSIRLAGQLRAMQEAGLVPGLSSLSTEERDELVSLRDEAN